MAFFTAISTALVGAGFSTFMVGLTTPAIFATYKEFAQ